MLPILLIRGINIRLLGMAFTMDYPIVVLLMQLQDNENLSSLTLNLELTNILESKNINNIKTPTFNINYT